MKDIIISSIAIIESIVLLIIGLSDYIFDSRLENIQDVSNNSIVLKEYRKCLPTLNYYIKEMDSEFYYVEYLPNLYIEEPVIDMDIFTIEDEFDKLKITSNSGFDIEIIILEINYTNNTSTMEYHTIAHNQLSSKERKKPFVYIDKSDKIFIKIKV